MSDKQPAPQKLVLVCPILPGRVEEWRRFIQEMADERGEVHAESRCRMSIDAEHIWIHETTDSAIAILVIETDRPNQMLDLIKTSEWPFDSWFRQQLLAHMGVDVGISIHRYLPELVFEWQAAS